VPPYLQLAVVNWVNYITQFWLSRELTESQNSVASWLCNTQTIAHTVYLSADTTTKLYIGLFCRAVLQKRPTLLRSLHKIVGHIQQCACLRTCVWHTVYPAVSATLQHTVYSAYSLSVRWHCHIQQRASLRTCVWNTVDLAVSATLQRTDYSAEILFWHSTARIILCQMRIVFIDSHVKWESMSEKGTFQTKILFSDVDILLPQTFQT